MYKIKAPDGSNNICGKNVAKFRKQLKPALSQRKFAVKLQVMGYDVDQQFVRRIETGERFVTDIEILILAKALGVSVEQLLEK